jgi:septum formation protein
LSFAVPRLLLASASPRRREILRGLGIGFDVASISLVETPLPGESPAATVERLARDKARAGAGRVTRLPPGRVSGSRPRSRLVLGADTGVVIDGRLHGKPAGRAEAKRILARLSGRTHEVMTGLALVEPSSLRTESGVSVTRVRFARLSRAEIARYVATGEPLDKAGAYAIQGRAGWFVERIEGSYTNVVGLPTELLRSLLARFRVREGPVRTR